MEKSKAAVAMGEKIRSYRKKRGMKQSELAEAVGTTTASVSRWERGEVEISLNQAKKIADILDVDIVDLMGIDTSNMIRRLDEDAIGHLAELATANVNEVINTYTDRIQNRVISLCSNEKIDERTMQIIAKPEQERLTQDQIDALQLLLSDVKDLKISADAAIDFWFEVMIKSTKGRVYATDAKLREESCLRQTSARAKALKERPEKKSDD